jgi:hypothetical protein
VKIARRIRDVWSQDRGLLTFEWILLITVIVIGVVGGYSVIRDGIIDELGDVAGAIIAVDQSFSTESPDCCSKCSWGSFQDDDPTPEVIRVRPATPVISQ